ncbi:MAG: NUDIX domain-containing protein [Actinomycetaceae bacterium]|nr:NUDIX domain-containing protein [Actinomycetaceae bacterium]
MSCKIPPITSPIYTSAVVFTSADAHVLMARKKGTKRFMFPGGKPESGENPLECALREINEEIGLILDPRDMELLGIWQIESANEPGIDVHCTVYLHTRPLEATPQACNEIAELAWLNPSKNLPACLSPLLRERVLPALGQQGIISLPTSLCNKDLRWSIHHLPLTHVDQLLTADAVCRQCEQKKRISFIRFLQDLWTNEPIRRGDLYRLADREGTSIAVMEIHRAQELPVNNTSAITTLPWDEEEVSYQQRKRFYSARGRTFVNDSPAEHIEATIHSLPQFHQNQTSHT